MLAFKDHECVGVNIGNYNSGVGSTGGGVVSDVIDIFGNVKSCRLLGFVGPRGGNAFQPLL